MWAREDDADWLNWQQRNNEPSRVSGMIATMRQGGALDVTWKLAGIELLAAEPRSGERPRSQ
jgi:hypothetical protein